MCSKSKMNKKMNAAYIALGGNLSNPETTFRQAVAEMKRSDIQIRGVSSLWHSPAWPAGLGHPDYVNAALRIETFLTATELLHRLHELESHFGRERSVSNAPRALDLDIIDFSSQVRASDPVLPHPRAQLRPFVLLPVWEIDPIWTHPVLQETALELLSGLPSKDVLDHAVIKRGWLES